MARDCEQLSPKAQEIFAKLKPFFPPDPWKSPGWVEEGVVVDSFSAGRFDLREHADRRRLEDSKKATIAYLVVSEASQTRSNLAGYTIGSSPLGKIMRENIELVLLLQDLDFQIETQDLVDGL